MTIRQLYTSTTEAPEKRPQRSASVLLLFDQMIAMLGVHGVMAQDV